MSRVTSFRLGPLVTASLMELYESKEKHDVTFIIEGEEFHGHRLILSARNRRMKTFLPENSSSSKLRFVNTTPHAFSVVLPYFYSGVMQVDGFSVEELLDLLRLVAQLQISELKDGLGELVRTYLSADNVTAVLSVAKTRGYSKLARDCYKYLRINAKKMLEHDSMLKLSWESIMTLVRWAMVREIVKFMAIKKWMDNNDFRPARSSGPT